MAQREQAGRGFGGRRAIVIGGSMAGLATARVLADHFEEVLLVERDALPDTIDPRKGVPQGRQLHGLLKRGLEVYEELFPGLGASLIAGGGMRVDFSKDLRWHHFGVEKVRFDSGVVAIMMSRPYLEREVRRRVSALSNVRLLDQRDVTGLIASEDRRCVLGVKTRRRDGESSEVEELRGELVVDACGRGSSTPKWLTELGLPKPEESKVRVDVGYASRLYRRPESTGLPYKALFIIGTPPTSKRLGVLFPIEGDRWLALVAGMLGDHPPADPDGFLEFAKQLPTDDLHRVLVKAEPISDIATYKFPAHLRRHYERMAAFPDGLAVLGDSQCSFNPIYGQGMTTAALSALALGECLTEQRERHGSSIRGLSRRFQVRSAKLADVPWMMATGEDLRYPEIEAKRPFGYGIMKWYLGRVHQAVAHDEVIALHFLRAMHMIEPPTKLFEPRQLVRVLTGI
jgi:2-polyprenyl-6-methoxyphenol hydroxylase-like FAD-dependent oxidoreductase